MKNGRKTLYKIAHKPKADAKKAIPYAGKSARPRQPEDKQESLGNNESALELWFLLREDPGLYVVEQGDLVTLEEAARLTGKTTHNIRDYIQRERITKFDPNGKAIKHAQNGQLRVSMKELRAFYTWYLSATRNITMLGSTLNLGSMTFLNISGPNTFIGYTPTSESSSRSLWNGF